MNEVAKKIVLAAKSPCECKFATKFASACECDGLVHLWLRLECKAASSILLPLSGLCFNRKCAREFVKIRWKYRRVSRDLAFAQREKKVFSDKFLLVFLCFEQEKAETTKQTAINHACKSGNSPAPYPECLMFASLHLEIASFNLCCPGT